MDYLKVDLDGHRSKVKVTRLKKRDLRPHLTDIQVILKVSGHMGQAQRSWGSRSAQRSRPLGQNGNFTFHFQDRLEGHFGGQESDGPK